jgi:hypothetical protein
MFNFERLKVGNKQIIDALVCEEVSLFRKYLRYEKKDGTPRVPPLIFVSQEKLTNLWFAAVNFIQESSTRTLN